MSDPAETLALILDELRLIRRQLAPDRLSHADHVLLDRLLPAIAGSRGSEPFTARELTADSVILALLAPVNGNANQALGNLFSRAAGVDIGGLTVEKLKTEHGVTLSQIVGTYR